MKGLKNFLWFLYKCFAAYTLLIYILILWIPLKGWVAGFMMMSFPVVVIVHLVSIPIWFIVERKKALLPLVMAALAGIFLSRTYSFGHKADEQELARSFSVMNYNVHSFQRNEDLKDPQVRGNIGDMKSWISSSDADILCMSEYFSDRGKLLNINKALDSAGYVYSAFYSRNKAENHTHSWGLAVLSKYPILAQRDTIFEAQNGMLQADIKIKGDTVRIIAVHLYSMTLKLSALVHQKQMDGVKKEGKITFERMRNGFVRRSAEMSALETWINASPYPVIVCGDFNEIPYGYVYSKMRSLLRNGFEEKGDGFGFTFNHLPYYIRIDHQFYSDDELQIQDFTTFDKVDYSDHYPVMGHYQFKRDGLGEKKD
ncbi:endonuclease/exonuclease/phosphatase family protein [Dyadobacter chenwenxiniae]|uniref:Endonuclease/exonuclease/phosphatase family protein n=1 Tax=Dyadobacter chenwenxiniae TaxID=2906456 RepID=A0A9X1PMH1_9BACT|nr:endonuclease/exonuclease/phosphatase family protein [Dyadobacter chenwenxiniae]MCF0063840.1 endonuclease/exonuclease/phosphatase family protein [Dyadobacter chenwenxiniae]UON83516.1 endonuclease/exonuclease/phosphatase family protein [Dyadobacter chenwenxiniae]